MTGMRGVLAAIPAVVAVLTAGLQCPVADAAPDAGALILSVEDVRVIAGNADLAPGAPADAPAGQHQFDDQAPAACRPVFNQDDAFAGGYTQFRSVSYTGPANRSVTQAVAVYPDSSSARAALTRLGQQLNACSQVQSPEMAVTVQVLDPKTFALCRAQCATLYRAAGPVLIGVDAVRFGDSDRIATTVLGQITGRAKAA